MFEVGDIIKNKTTSGRTNISYYAFITYMQHNPPEPFSIMKVQGLNFDWQDTMLTYREAQLWWEKVE
jgi:hypothetical protein